MSDKERLIEDIKEMIEKDENGIIKVEDRIKRRKEYYMKCFGTLDNDYVKQMIKDENDLIEKYKLQ